MVSIISPDHPLMRDAIRVAKCFAEVMDEWEKHPEFHARHGLLHGMFADSKMAAGDRIERILFCLSIAEGHERAENFGETEGTRADDPTFGQPDYCRPKVTLARKAFAVLVDGFFNPCWERDGYTGEPKYARFLLNRRIFEALLHFFLVENGAMPNFTDMQTDRQDLERREKITWDFLFMLCSRILTCYFPDLETTPEQTHMFRGARDRAVEMIWVKRQIRMMETIELIEDDPVAMTTLRNLALWGRNTAAKPMFQSIEQGVAYRYWQGDAARVYHTLETRRKEEERRQVLSCPV